MSEQMTVSSQRYRLGYHLMTPGGWMNDPNGFSFFQGWYHMFYQFYPYAAEWGPMHWGHARSKDLLHWETLPTAIAPDENEDGCFSGSAVVYDDKLWLIYTGHHYLGDKSDPENFREDQRIAYSEDGVHFTKYEGNPVLTPPADNTKHFRDPKVWEEDGTFYMILGSQSQDGLGRALLYVSPDLKSWQPVSVLDKSRNLAKEGYMWECPDFFRVDGQDVLLMSPQGLEADGDLYKNLNQTGYLIGTLDPETHTLERGGFTEIDNGHDFYATQTLLTSDGRRVMIAWFNAWDSPMYEKADGWAGALTIPRELHVVDGELHQQPIREMDSLRSEEWLRGTAEPGKAYAVPRQSEVQLDFGKTDPGKLFEISDGDHKLTLTLEPNNRLVLVRNTKDGERAAHLTDSSTLSFRIFVDTSSAEIFVNDGVRTFSERMYWQGALKLTTAASAEAVIYELERETNQY